MTIVTLVQNYSARTLELFPVGAKFFYVQILHYVEISPLACKFGPSWKIVRYVDLARWREIISLLGCGIGST